MQVMSSIRKEFVASHLRSQVNQLCKLLDNIEEGDSIDCEFANDSLKEIETGLRQIRKVCSDN